MWQQLNAEVHQLCSNVAACIPSIQPSRRSELKEHLLRCAVRFHVDLDAAMAVTVAANRLEFEERHGCVCALVTCAASHGGPPVPRAQQMGAPTLAGCLCREAAPLFKQSFRCALFLPCADLAQARIYISVSLRMQFNGRAPILRRAVYLRHRGE